MPLMHLNVFAIDVGNDCVEKPNQIEGVFKEFFLKLCQCQRWHQNQKPIIN